MSSLLLLLLSEFPGRLGWARGEERRRQWKVEWASGEEGKWKWKWKDSAWRVGWITLKSTTSLRKFQQIYSPGELPRDWAEISPSSDSNWSVGPVGNLLEFAGDGGPLELQLLSYNIHLLPTLGSLARCDSSGRQQEPTGRVGWLAGWLALRRLRRVAVVGSPTYVERGGGRLVAAARRRRRLLLRRESSRAIATPATREPAGARAGQVRAGKSMKDGGGGGGE